MTVVEYRGDDDGYLNWVSVNEAGYVLNINRGLNVGTARLHKATCHTITGEPARGKNWTGPYVKICSMSHKDLDEWAQRHVGAQIQRCRTCQP